MPALRTSLRCLMLKEHSGLAQNRNLLLTVLIQRPYLPVVQNIYQMKESLHTGKPAILK
jgi:hypothetical protein